MKPKLLGLWLLCGMLSPVACSPFVPTYSGGPYGPYKAVPVGYSPTGGPPIVVIPPGNPPVVSNLPVGTIPTTPSVPSNPVPPSQPTVPTPPPSTPTTPTKPTPSQPSTPQPLPATNPPRVGWEPWPLPPVAQRPRQQGTPQISLLSGQQTQQAGRRAFPRPLSVVTRPGSVACERRHGNAGLPGRPLMSQTTAPADEPINDQRADGTPSTPQEDLKYRGGYIVQHLEFVNLYVGGGDAWDANEAQLIDEKTAAAMSDRHLNNVLMQYFNNQPITSTAHASHPLVGYVPKTVSKGDVYYYLQYLYEQGYLNGFDLNRTCFNFLLPPGTILNDEELRSNRASTANALTPVAAAEEKEEEEEDELEEYRKRGFVIPENEEGNSLIGLGGFHGSIHLGGTTLYYSVCVYSEKLPNGTVNGIPVFDQSWKNVVGTLYHELCEFRTDPDVEDAIRAGNDPRGEKYLGWISDRGMEVGDFPITLNVPLSVVFQEVPLADGSGTVPIQLQYSNAVHGPEGPIPAPH